jgi:hypothetical protein
MSQALETTGEVRCAECGVALAPGQDRETTEGGVFCRPCFEHLRSQVVELVKAQGRDVDYPKAILGGLGGAALGVLAWWGFTVLTKIAFGLVAVVIGVAVGKGVVFGAGGKRARGLQMTSVIIATVAFFYASYLVIRSFVSSSVLETGEQLVLPWVPDLATFIRVVSLGFGLMDVVFLGIVIWEAWRIPAPLQLGSTPTAPSAQSP